MRIVIYSSGGKYYLDVPDDYFENDYLLWEIYNENLKRESENEDS